MYLEERTRMEEVEVGREPGRIGHIDRKKEQKLVEAGRNLHWQEQEEAEGLVDRTLCSQEDKEAGMVVFEAGRAVEAVDRTRLEVAPAPEEDRDHLGPKRLQEEEEDNMLAGGKAAEVVRIWSRQCCYPLSWSCPTPFLHWRA